MVGSKNWFSVHTKELRKEAGVWDKQSSELKGVANKSEALRIDRYEAGVFQLFITAYGEAVHEMMARCEEGHQRTAEIANALREVASAYDKAESEGEQLFKKIF
ncbi:hypothetical protein GCM10023196_031430 [Actinoallomurus vinaceus]|uniref:Uncharacterized protein n=1 Tax=Actinoallomurus vinaceus TaxID=1080074 RepID=A0ABP8U7P2_9ACTN